MSDLTVVNGPLELYWAPVGTAMPAIGTDPTSASFQLIGSSGDDNYTEDGVSISTNQTVESFTPLGKTAPTKAFRTNEDLVVSVTMADLSLSQVRLALNQNTVNSGTGEDDISLNRGIDVSTVALLVRGVGKSPEFDGGDLQFELFEVYENGSQELSFVKGEPAGVLLEFHALDDGTNGVGTLRAATA